MIFAVILALLPPCQTEDSTWCGWDAATQGNGTGRSFIAFTETFIIQGEPKWTLTKQ